MGKWTLGHHDEVLRAKMKNLVTGAVKRMKLEDSEPFMSYEAFVEELDEGDSFTATLIEVLVKEIADRRTRPSVLDRRLISERTAKSLSMQADSLHVYSSRRSSHRFRRGYTVTDIVADLTDDDEEPVDNRETSQNDLIWDGEGARLNTELYEAYAPPSSSELLDSLRPSEAPSLATRVSGIAQFPRPPLYASPRSVSPPLRSSSHRHVPLSHSSGIGASLSRNNSISRAIRTRSIDFDEFTARRRSSIRQSIQDQGRPEPAESTDGTWRFRLNRGGSMRDAQPPLAPSSRNLYSSPFWLATQRSRRQEVGGAFPWSPDPSEGPSDHNTDTAGRTPPPSSGGPSSSQTWYALTAAQSAVLPAESSSLSTRRSSISDINEARRQVIAPRLRRGGIRPPESLLSRYASPASNEEPERIELPVPQLPEWRSPSPTIPVDMWRHTLGTEARERERERNLQVLMDLLDEADHPEGGRTPQLPTPRSVTPTIENNEEQP